MLGNCPDEDRFVPSVQADMDTVPTPAASLEKSADDWNIPESGGPLYGFADGLDDWDPWILGVTAAREPVDNRMRRRVLKTLLERDSLFANSVIVFQCSPEAGTLKRFAISV